MKRKELWNYIIEQSTKSNLPWILAGDFYSILSTKERINDGVYNSIGNEDFVDCIFSSKLVEPNFIGIFFFTWRGGQNLSVHSKIGQVFVNSLWMNMFKHFCINFGNHSLSGHAPINIKFMIQNEKKKRISFRYKNSWHLQEGYQLALQSALSLEFHGNPLHILICRLKVVKSALKTWMKSKENIYIVVAHMNNEANEIYSLLVKNPLNNILIDQYNMTTSQIHSIMRKIATDNEQRMKLNWLVKGDRPTNFFYSRVKVVNPNQGGNYLLNSNGTWTLT